MPEQTKAAIALLAPVLQAAALRLPIAQLAVVEEIRLRAGQPMILHLDRSDAVPEPERILTQRLLEDTLTQAAQGSAHTAMEQLRAGFFTAPGGHRIGVAGRAVVQDGAVTGFRELSSLCIRVAREKHGIADALCEGLWCYGPLPNTLILSPPGYGKTTLLRDMIRCISQTRTVALADERGEVSGMADGAARMDIGFKTDVIVGAPKATAVLSLLRSMSPQVLAMDEITAPEDVRALMTCLGCGVSLICTAHAAGYQEFLSRPVCRELGGIFSRIIIISRGGGARQYRMEEIQ